MVYHLYSASDNSGADGVPPLQCISFQWRWWCTISTVYQQPVALMVYRLYIESATSDADVYHLYSASETSDTDGVPPLQCISYQWRWWCTASTMHQLPVTLMVYRFCSASATSGADLYCLYSASATSDADLYRLYSTSATRWRWFVMHLQCIRYQWRWWCTASTVHQLPVALMVYRLYSASASSEADGVPSLQCISYKWPWWWTASAVHQLPVRLM